MAETYDIGDKPRITVTFTALPVAPATVGAVTDPASVVCRVKTPNGVTWIYAYNINAELTKTSTGIYNLDVRLTEHGMWAYKWNGGPDAVLSDASKQGTLQVRRSVA